MYSVCFHDRSSVLDDQKVKVIVQKQTTDRLFLTMDDWVRSSRSSKNRWSTKGMGHLPHTARGFRRFKNRYCNNNYKFENVNIIFIKLCLGISAVGMVNLRVKKDQHTVIYANCKSKIPICNKHDIITKKISINI